MPDKKSKFIGVYVDPSLYKRLKKQADKDFRSISGYMRKLIEIDTNKPIGTSE